MIRRFRLFVVPMLALGMLLAFSCAPALAVDGSHLLGSWAGFSQSAPRETDPPQPIHSFFDVFTDLGDGSFQGQVTITIVPCVFPGVGHVTRGGVLDFRGFEAETGETLTMRGVLRLLGDGSVRLLAARWVIRAEGQREPIDGGYLLWLQRMDGPNWQDPPQPINIMGEWSGGWRSQMRGGMMGMADSTIDWQMGTGFSGDLSFFDVFTEIDINFMMHGTVGDPLKRTDRPGTRRMAMIGADQNGTVAILIGLLLPAVQAGPERFTGQYHVFNSFFDVFTEFLNPRKGTAFDRGDFELPAVQRQ